MFICRQPQVMKTLSSHEANRFVCQVLMWLLSWENLTVVELLFLCGSNLLAENGISHLYHIGKYKKHCSHGVHFVVRVFSHKPQGYFSLVCHLWDFCLYLVLFLLHRTDWCHSGMQWDLRVNGKVFPSTVPVVYLCKGTSACLFWQLSLHLALKSK